MPRYEIPDVRGEVRDVVAPVADTSAAHQLAQDAMTTAAAAYAALPVPAVQNPAAERIGAAVGDGARYAREDHAHPRLTSTTYATLAADGTATVAFSRTFVNKPGINLTETDATTGSQPLVLRGLTWVQDSAGLYTGVVIQGRRAQMLPTINPLSGTIALLTGVITGVNGIVAQLTGYNVFGGSAVGATVSVIAVARSDVGA